MQVKNLPATSLFVSVNGLSLSLRIKSLTCLHRRIPRKRRQSSCLKVNECCPTSEPYLWPFFRRSDDDIDESLVSIHVIVNFSPACRLWLSFALML